MRDVLTLILGGGRGAGLYPLTQTRSKAAVSVAGKYRLIDIPISNCLNSGFNRAYVLTQFLSVSLHRHIANTYKFDPFGQGFVAILAAQQTNEAADWYKGSADAVRQQVRHVEEDGAKYVLVLAGDQICRMDFHQLYRAHVEGGAAVTLAVHPVPRPRTATLGVLRLDDAGRVTHFVEKPQTAAQLDALRLPAGWLEARGLQSDGREFLANMGIYLFNRDVLIELLRGEPTADDFGNIFPHHLGRHRVRGHLFDGYWENLETLRAYHAANLALASDRPPFDFHSPDGVIYTRMRHLPASRVSAARLEGCLVSDGCVVQAGARLERCVVGLRGRIGRDVVLRDTVVCGADRFETAAERAANRARGRPDLGIGDGSVIEGAVVDKDCCIGTNVHISNRRRLQEAEGDGYVIRDGLVVIPNGAVVPDGTVI